jgi:DNA-binding PadR family transcriptional regulator
MEQKLVKVLKDPKQIELFENPNYARIISILRKGELTIKEIHKEFNKGYEDKKTLTSIYRYMEKLVEYDLIFVSKEELKRGHLLERYYTRTAQILLFEDERLKEDALNASVELLSQIYGVDAEKAGELKKLLHHWIKDMENRLADFYEKYGTEIFMLEKQYGFKAMKNAAQTFYDLLYFKEPPAIFEEIFKILKE